MSAFPPTDWKRLEVLRAGTPADRDAVFADLFVRYRQPILGFLQFKGFAQDRAEDLVQDFFTYCLTDQVFEKADAQRGRFRSLMLTALQRFAAKQHRHSLAEIRRPPGGFVSSDTTGPEGTPLDVRDGDATPESAFQRGWAEALMARVLASLEREFSGPDRRRHYDIFSRFLVAPMLHGAEAPTQHDLAREYGLTEKDVANRLGTAKRAYQRLLREEIATYAESDDEIDREVRELFHTLGNDRP